MAALKLLLTALIVLLGVFYTSKALPLADRADVKGTESDESDSDESKSDEYIDLKSNWHNLTLPYNGTKDLYVIKAVVYEIGILTDVSDDDNATDFDSSERIDLTFFDAHRNDSHINLGRVPLPIQTNISGQVLTGIAPVDLGAFSSAQELLRTLPISGTIVNITHSDTGYFQLKTSNLTQFEKPHILSMNELTSISDLRKTFPDLNQLTPVQAAGTSKDEPKHSSNLIRK